MHTHLLPGVDDGIQNLMESFATLEFMQQTGVKRIWLTPHVMIELPWNTHEKLAEHFNMLKDICPFGLELKLAAEYMLDAGFGEQMKGGLLTLDGRHVLVETSYMSAPPDLQNMLYEIALEGYIPVLAHPERYLYMAREEYVSFRAKGYKFQLNLFSLAGVYGSRPRQNAEYLLKQGLYDYTGSDLHSMDSYRNSLKRFSLTGRQEKEVRRILENNHSLW